MANKRQRNKRLKNTIIPAKDMKEYSRLKKNANAKIKRVNDKYGLNLKDEIEIPKIKEFKNHKEFENWKEKITSFTDRSNLKYQYEKNKYGVVASKELLKEMEENTKKAQKKSEEFIDKYKDKPVYRKGKELGYTVGDRMSLRKDESVAGITKQQDFDFNKFESKARLMGRAELLKSKASGEYFNESMTRMRNNFMTALKGTFNSDADELLDKISQIPPDDFFEMFLMKTEFTFEDYASDGSIDGNERNLALLESYVDAYFDGNIDMSLKGF